jgi:hypothetical protein
MRLRAGLQTLYHTMSKGEETSKMRRQPSGTAILATCKTIYDEAHDLLYNNVFVAALHRDASRTMPRVQLYRKFQPRGDIERHDERVGEMIMTSGPVMAPESALQIKH